MSTVSQNYPRLLDAVGVMKARWRAAYLTEGVFLAVVVIGGVLATLLLIDNIFHLDTLGRLLLALVLGGTFVMATLRFIVRRWLDDRRDDYYAALYEEAYPDLSNTFINALQLGRGNQDGHSPDLIERIVRDAAERADDLDPSRGIDPQPSRRAGLAALASVAVLTIYAIAAAPSFANALTRLLLPLADIPPYTATRIPESGVKPGDTSIPEGVTLTIDAKLDGVIPARPPILTRRPTNGPNVAVEMKAAAQGNDRFTITLPPISDSFDYRITAGDGRSRWFRVTVVKRPAVERVTVAVQPPAYTGRPAGDAIDTGGEITAVMGSLVTVNLSATKPLKDGDVSLLCESGAIVPLTKAGSLTEWQGRFLLWPAGKPVPSEVASLPVIHEPTRYQVRMRDVDGYDDVPEGQENRRLWRSIVPTRDQAPTVAITQPNRDLVARPEETLNLQIEANDDFDVASVRLVYQRENDAEPVELIEFPGAGPHRFAWKLADTKLKSGERLVYWARATDRNDVTGPGVGESRKYRLAVYQPEESGRQADQKISDYIDLLAALVQRQKDARAQTFSNGPLGPLATEQAGIRDASGRLARLMEKDPLPLGPIVRKLDALVAGLMAVAVKQLETGRDASDSARAAPHRAAAIETQDQIIAALEELLARMQRGEQARKELRKLERSDKTKAGETKQAIVKTIQNLDAYIKDTTEFLKGFERLPAKPGEMPKDEEFKVPPKDLEEFKARAEKWAKGTVNEMTKMASGFVDDFALREDVNSIFEEVEKKARPKAETLPVALEDMGVGMATRMKEDLEMWLLDVADAVKWEMEEPDRNTPFKVPEMPLPSELQDIVGDLLQKAEEFDEEADDVTSAWGDNLDQAGWGVSDGPISTFSAKGKTGNDLPNNQEVTGRSGDGRRGKSKGQMVGDTSRALPGRKTPARVGDERYEPGQLKQEGTQDPNGATGGGKKAGGGRKGLQGGSPPDLTRDIGRLSEKQAGMQEKASEVAKKLDTLGISGKGMIEGLKLFEDSLKDMRERRYEDAARKRKEGLTLMRGVMTDVDPSAARAISRNKDLPPELRREMLQAADESLPAGYETLLKNYYKALSGAEK